MHRSAIVTLLFLMVCGVFAGCGGGSSNKANTVASIVLSPTSFSLNSGDVVQISATPENSANTAISANLTYSSSNSAIVTISNAGLICAGVWDSLTTPVVCNGFPGGVGVSGSATITVTGGGVSSTATVNVHAKVTKITVDPVAGCTSSSQMKQFTAHAFSGSNDITSQIGQFTFGTLDGSVATIDNTGLLTAHNPGATQVFASASGLNSAGVPYRTCMPVRIRLHISGDPAGMPTTSATMTIGQNITLQADSDDEIGFTTNGASVTILTDNPASTTVSGTTLTANSGGGAGIIAACIPPVCGNGINQPVYSNLFRVTIPNAATPPSTVFVTSSFAPPSGTSPTLIPIDTSAATAGTAITLPGVPNSLVIGTGGARGFLGTDAGLVTLDPAAKTVTLVAPGIVGKVLAVSANGNKAIISNAANNPSTGTPIEPNPANQRLWAFDSPSNTLQSFILPGAIAAAFDNDNFKAFIAVNNGNVYVFSPVVTLQILNPGGSPKDVVSLSSDPLVFLANGSAVNVFATCNNAQLPDLAPTSAPQLVQSILNSDTIVIANQTGLDVETVTVTPPSGLTNNFCPNNTNVSFSNNFIDFGLGAITARQLLVGSLGVRAVVLPAGINKILVGQLQGGAPIQITLPAGATEPLVGAIVPDINSMWVSVAGTNTVDKIDLINNADVAQVPTTFKKSDNTAAPPNLLALRFR
ncbi:MAG TPA: Ig-like domain-containing protein [Candidatus Angelobacter sp.]|jgi:hypothetical protein|nr:Ig-like domain-containing protein [Candidatus Angelobacter sp.]